MRVDLDAASIVEAVKTLSSSHVPTRIAHKQHCRVYTTLDTMHSQSPDSHDDHLCPNSLSRSSSSPIPTSVPLSAASPTFLPSASDVPSTERASESNKSVNKHKAFCHLGAKSYPGDDADQLERELADAESYILGLSPTPKPTPDHLSTENGDDQDEHDHEALERLGDAYVRRVYGHRMDNLRRALLAFRYALAKSHPKSRHAVRLCAKLSSVLTYSALVRQRRCRSAPPPYDPAPVVALTQALPLPQHAQKLSPSPANSRAYPPFSYPHIYPVASHNQDESLSNSIQDCQDIVDESGQAKSQPVNSESRLKSPTSATSCVHGWPSVDGWSGTTALTNGESTAAALCTGEYSLSMYADFPHWCKNVVDAQAYLQLRALHGVLYDVLQPHSVDPIQRKVSVVRSPTSSVTLTNGQSDTLLALCLNALEPIFLNTNFSLHRKHVLQPNFSNFAHVPTHRLISNVPGLKAVIATDGRLSTAPSSTGVGGRASPLVHQGSHAALQAARACGAQLPDIDRVHAVVVLCRAYVRIHRDAGDIALIKARDTLVHALQALPKLREHWSTHVACKRVACAPVVDLLDDLADDISSLATVVRASSNSALSKCAVC